MATIVQICNMALTHIGRAPVNSLTEASAEAREVNRHYAFARDSLIHATQPKFATRRYALALQNTDSQSNVVDDPDSFAEHPADEEEQVQGLWRYSYALPTGMLAIVQLNDAEMTYKYGAPYELMAASIYCNINPAYLTYVSRITDSEQYPVIFADALAYGLAARIAYPLTREAKIRNDMIALYDRARMEAEIWDMNNSHNGYDHVSEFIDARE